MTGSAPVKETANDRFKRGFASWFWASLTLATLAHALVFIAGPQFGVENVAFGASDLTTVDIPDEIEIPPPPQDIARPPTPVIAETDFDADLTIPLTTFDANPVETLPPPPSQQGEEDLAAAPTFTPMTVRPELKNPAEITRALVDYYPRMLQDAGIGGTVSVWFYIDQSGRVVRTLLNQSSGYDALDDAALKVANLMDFRPAYNYDRPVAVWVSIPVTFEAVM